MAITKDKKKEIISDLKERIKDAESVVFVRFSNLSVGEGNNLRDSLKENNGNFKVSKKTLLKRVLEESKYEGEMPELLGEVAIAYSKDAVIPAKEVFNFGKKHDKKVEILGGVLNGVFLSKEDAVRLAQIPGREELYGMFVNVINAPVSGFVTTLSGITRQFVGVLDQIAKAKA